MVYASVGLHLSPKGLILIPEAGEVHPEFQMLFYPSNVIKNIFAIGRALSIIRRHPLLSKQVSYAHITFSKNDKLQTKNCTLHNLEVYAWFKATLKPRNVFDYLFKVVLFVLGGDMVVQIIKNHYTEDYDVDPSNSAIQIERILPWAPPPLRILTRLTALEDKLKAIGDERQRTGKRVAKRYEEQFPSVKPKVAVKAPEKPIKPATAEGDGGSSGMLNITDSVKANAKNKASTTKA